MSERSDIILHDTAIELKGEIQVTEIDDSGDQRVLLSGKAGKIFLGNIDGYHAESVSADLALVGTEGRTIGLWADEAKIVVGSTDAPGEIYLSDGTGIGGPSIQLEGGEGNIILGNHSKDGDLVVKNANDHITVGVNGQNGNITLGGHETDGDLILLDSDRNTRIHLNAEVGPVSEDVRILMHGKDGRIQLGGADRGGKISLRNADDEEAILLTSDGNGPAEASIWLNGEESEIRLGGADEAGRLCILDKDGEPKIEADQTGLGVYDWQERKVVQFGTISDPDAWLSGSTSAGVLQCGTTGKRGMVILKDEHNQARIWLDGDTGRIASRDGVLSGRKLSVKQIHLGIGEYNRGEGGEILMTNSDAETIFEVRPDGSLQTTDIKIGVGTDTESLKSKIESLEYQVATLQTQVDDLLTPPDN